MKTRDVITIDGVAASGKSSLAKALAQKLNFAYLNSGNLYRAVGVIALRKNILLDNEVALVDSISAGSLIIKEGSDGKSEVWYQGKKISDSDLDSVEIATAASKIATLPKVRNELLPIQREAFPDRGLVAEGRDMGSVVFPNAKVKVFISATSKVRAQRRANQLNSPERVSEIEEEIKARDIRDSTRAVSPMIVAKDAIEFCNSDEDFNSQVEKLFSLVASKLK